MKIIKKDQELLNKEIVAKQRKLSEDERAQRYYDSLKRNRSFQKYVVERIFKKNIDDLTDTRKIVPKGFDIARQKEEVAELLAISMTAQKKLEKILGEIIN